MDLIHICCKIPTTHPTHLRLSETSEEGLDLEAGVALVGGRELLGLATALLLLGIPLVEGLNNTPSDLEGLDHGEV